MQVVYDGVKRENILWVEDRSMKVADRGMLGDMQGSFRMGRRTDNNLFMLERMIEIVKVRKECLVVPFIDMEKFMIE